MIKIQLKNELASKQIAQIATQLQKPRQLYGVLGETLKKIHQERFKQEVDPEGKNGKPFPRKPKLKKLNVEKVQKFYVKTVI